MINDTISRQHCYIIFSGKNSYIFDLRTTNGTYVDEEYVDQKMELPEKCQIKLGDVRFQFRRML